MEFAKLKKFIPINDYNVKNHVVAYTKRISYSQVETSANLLQVIPERYRHKFFILVMQINDQIPPHTDSKVKCVINFYLSPGDYVTKFWKITNNDPTKTSQVENQTNGRLFEYDALEYLSEFVADQNEAYILDVTQPHSVEKNTGGDRVALCVQTRDYSFDEVRQMLQETGYL